MYRPSMEKSAWFTPEQFGVAIEYCSAMVCGSRKSRRRGASATTSADLPAGEKYMLYGSGTGTDGAGRPVFGARGVTLREGWPSALVGTDSDREAEDGVTC